MRRDDAGGGGGTGFHELFDSVRRSISFRPAAAAPAEPPAIPFGGGGGGGIGVRISSCLRKSRGMGLLGLISKSPSPPRRLLPPTPDESGGGGGGGRCGGDGKGEENPPIRWRKGELIGCGAFGQVYLGMNLDSGELLAVKQVLIGTSNATREKAQAHIKELEEEVKLLKNLSHPNIVRYLGTVREEDTLNILLEFVPGGSIQSLLGKLGSFPEPVIRKYTKQILQGLEYLHNNAIIHRDIKGANILVDNKGCIKLADFGASKQVAKLIPRRTNKIKSFNSNRDNVEVLKEPELRSTASDLLQHPFVTGELDNLQSVNRAAHKETSVDKIPAHDMPNVLGLNHSSNWSTLNSNKSTNAKPLWEGGCDDDDMCVFADKDDYRAVGSSYNPMSEPFDNWENKFDISAEQNSRQSTEFSGLANHTESSITENDFTFPCEGSCEDDDVLTESKIKAFLEEKALDLKKLQTPLYEEFYNTVNAGNCQGAEQTSKGKFTNSPKLPPRGKSSPSKMKGGLSPTCDNLNNTSPVRCSKQFPSSGVENSRILREIASPQLNEFADKSHLDVPDSPSISFAERQKKWKEELDQELERERVMRLAGGGKTPSPNRGPNVKRAPC
ncbi:hypothetical protein PR202_ga15957 [Eleusine coracana subsp. coracana]|uniref:mitogen-activated protein kinase kinase kinase n=1 Tax=Eleusine coracana subsp. coracana TaxID=191504 RepID=A0AAV5CLI1_ELECO|nr:hypothetical protein PR202_ga15957 [Eleusine coracana subsp. coracana]